jgi:hypothetical protein
MMRIQSSDFVVDFGLNDRFVSLKRIDPSKLGGLVAEGDFIEGKFHPKRNMSFTGTELEQITNILKKLIIDLQW